MARYQNIKQEEKEENQMSKSVGLNRSVFIDEENESEEEEDLNNSRRIDRRTTSKS